MLKRVRAKTCELAFRLMLNYEWSFPWRKMTAQISANLRESEGKKSGSPSRIRTYGHSINSRMLYR